MKSNATYQLAVGIRTTRPKEEGTNAAVILIGSPGQPPVGIVVRDNCPHLLVEPGGAADPELWRRLTAFADAHALPHDGSRYEVAWLALQHADLRTCVSEASLSRLKPTGAK